MTPVRRVLFLGSKRLGLRVLQALHRLEPAVLLGAGTIDDRDDPRGVPDDLAAFCAGAGLPLAVVADRGGLLDLLRAARPELVVVSGWYRLLDPEVLACAPGGFLGVHPSLLPAYRGGSPLVWAVANGDREVGVSLFTLTEGMDEGDLWAQRAVPVGPLDPIAEVLDRVERATLDLIEATYGDILARRARPRAQRRDGVSYAALRRPEDGLVRWDWPAVRVHDFVRAQSRPYPGAFTTAAGRTVRLWSARPAGVPCFGTPGQVVRVVGDEVHIACGDRSALAVLRVQPDGGPEQPAAAVLGSLRLRLAAGPP